ncbi:unnamed protein product [Rhodiola kirilowii]
MTKLKKIIFKKTIEIKLNIPYSIPISSNHTLFSSPLTPFEDAAHCTNVAPFVRQYIRLHLSSGVEFHPVLVLVNEINRVWGSDCKQLDAQHSVFDTKEKREHRQSWKATVGNGECHSSGSLARTSIQNW